MLLVRATNQESVYYERMQGLALSLTATKIENSFCLTVGSLRAFEILEWLHTDAGSSRNNYKMPPQLSQATAPHRNTSCFGPGIGTYRNDCCEIYSNTDYPSSRQFELSVKRLEYLWRKGIQRNFWSPCDVEGIHEATSTEMSHRMTQKKDDYFLLRQGLNGNIEGLLS